MGSHSVTCHPTPVNAPCLSTSQASRSVLDLSTPEGWKAELTLMVGYIPRWFTYPQTVTHPRTTWYRPDRVLDTLIPVSESTFSPGCSHSSQELPTKLRLLWIYASSTRTVVLFACADSKCVCTDGGYIFCHTRATDETSSYFDAFA